LDLLQTFQSEISISAALHTFYHLLFMVYIHLIYIKALNLILFMF